MLTESCFGIDVVAGKWLVVVQRQNGKSLLYRRFENTADGLMGLLRAIRDAAVKPKVCIKSAGRAALNLALGLCSIPQAEVILISDSGLHNMKSKLVKAGPEGTAEILARCAERII
jgi:hypothetical protein